MKEKDRTPVQDRATNVARVALGTMLLMAGISHISFLKKEFQAQVPNWIPVSKNLTVIISGIIEMLLGLCVTFWVKRKVFWGWVTAAFFVLIFPGNIAQFMHHRAAFGLDSNFARGARLFFQPVLVAWALWSTGAWAYTKWKKGW